MWDHTTNWTPAVHGRQTIGTNNPYLKDREVFLSDFRRLLDFLGRKQFAGLCVWGLLRQSHGGVWAETLGDGDIDHAPIVERLKELEFDGPIVIEQATEDGTPDTLGPVEAHRRSFNWVTRVFGQGS